MLLNSNINKGSQQQIREKENKNHYTSNNYILKGLPPLVESPTSLIDDRSTSLLTPPYFTKRIQLWVTTS